MHALTNLELIAHAQDHFRHGYHFVTVILDPVAMVLLGELTCKKLVHTYQVSTPGNDSNGV